VQKNKGKQAEQPLAFPVGSCFVIRPRSPSSVFALHNKQFSVCFYAFIVPFGKGMFQSIGFYFEWCSVYIIVQCWRWGKAVILSRWMPRISLLSFL